jgi:hypothetical protein
VFLFFYFFFLCSQPGAAELEWFPWGVPPVQHVLDTTLRLEDNENMTKEDDMASDFLREILDPFSKMQQAQQQQQSPGSVDNN